MEILAPDIGVSDPVCNDEECTITTPVINTTIKAEYTTEKSNVKESVQESVCKLH